MTPSQRVHRQDSLPAPRRVSLEFGHLARARGDLLSIGHEPRRGSMFLESSQGLTDPGGVVCALGQHPKASRATYQPSGVRVGRRRILQTYNHSVVVCPPNGVARSPTASTVAATKIPSSSEDLSVCHACLRNSSDFCDRFQAVWQRGSSPSWFR